MTKEECGKFLNELISFYPNVLRQGTDQRTLFELWNEVLQDAKYTDIHKALIGYFKEDKRGFAPTAGQLIAGGIEDADRESEELDDIYRKTENMLRELEEG